MFIRRAELKDLPGIKQLIKGGFGRDDMERALKRRYGDNYNLYQMIDTCALSLVSLGEGGAVESFLALSVAPPASLPLATENDVDGNIKSYSLYDNQWDTWIADNYNVTDANVQIYNSVFINFFCCKGDDVAPILEELFRAVFEMDYSIENIAYFLPESLIMFPPFSSPRPIRQVKDKLSAVRLKKSKLSNSFLTMCQAYSHCVMPFTLNMCQRKEFYPIFDIRRAKVEDCDDLIPILRNNKLLTDSHGDHFMSDLLEQKDQATRAVVDGEIVGFMCVDRRTNQEKLREMYHLSHYDNLIKVKHPEQAVATPEQLAVQNTFHITLFCIDAKYSAFSGQFLTFAFQNWPDLEYCALTTPETAPVSPILKFFSPVESKFANNDNLLYITNRYALRGPVQVSRTTPEMISKIGNLTQDMNNIDDFLVCIQSKPNDQNSVAPFISFSATIDTQVVGTVVLERCSSIMNRALLDQFDIEYFLDTKWSEMESNYSIVRYMIINPLFESQSRYITREILRQLKLNCLLYPKNTNLNDLATKRIADRNFVPVKPRRNIEYPGNMRDGELMPPEIEGSLQIITVPQLFEPRLVVNTPIVVVGGSDTGLAFLENLAYTPHIRFTNLILISNEGIPTMEKEWPYVNTQCYSYLLLKQLSLENYVTVIQDTMVQISRHDKTVTLKSSTLESPRTVRYEYLVLTPGLQFNLTDANPKFENILGAHEMNKADFKKMKNHLALLASNDKLGKIVIYGRSIDAHMAVEYCLSIGISQNRIHLYDPLSDNQLFQDQELAEISKCYLKSSGINYHEGHALETFEEMDGKIFGLKFFDKMHKKVFVGSIGAFLYADVKRVNYHTFHAVNQANLVFDESIVIDNVFRTRDPYVFAAGTATKYSINLKTNWKHQFCESREVGTRLSNFMLHLFDPNLPINPNLTKQPVNNYVNSVKEFAKLPGGLVYFNYDIPKLSNYEHDAKRRDLVIHHSEKEFSRIRVDPKGYVYSFTYLGPRKIATGNLACLYGRHEKYFNRLVSRFDEGVIPDFMSFFQETWALVMFHDRFPTFVASLLDDASERVETNQIITDLEARTSEMTVEEADETYDKFDKSEAREEWNKSVFEFLMSTQVYKSYP